MKKLIVLSLFLAATFMAFAQERIQNNSIESYHTKLQEEGYTVVKYGYIKEGVLPQEVPLQTKRYYFYKVYLVPFGKLKKKDVSAWIDWIPTASYKASEGQPYASGRTATDRKRETEIEFIHKTRRKKFKLSSDNYLYYVIGEKPMN